MKRVGLALSAVSISLALVLTGCGSTGVKNRPGGGTQQTEDCDFDDMIEGDSDCYGSKKKTTTSKKPTTTAKPTTKVATPTKKASSGSSGSKKK
ncbi:hypothetical protein MYRNA_212 [Mycobacterium phage Myrna]|uniref:Lipoprotein n=1 Tax=Mycobacterium phage Myrna TaxID=546805 RepID=B5LJI2_9CAUD|nr:gp212 [Mycobacterium phage Myrna]ACH62179.1 hypothetical protein MYRNA_212 [Mycobacterium phage Myrna]